MDSLSWFRLRWGVHQPGDGRGKMTQRKRCKNCCNGAEISTATSGRRNTLWWFKQGLPLLQALLIDLSSVIFSAFVGLQFRKKRGKKKEEKKKRRERERKVLEFNTYISENTISCETRVWATVPIPECIHCDDSHLVFSKPLLLSSPELPGSPSVIGKEHRLKENERWIRICPGSWVR